jgi:hypothetical protein
MASRVRLFAVVLGLFGLMRLISGPPGQSGEQVNFDGYWVLSHAESFGLVAEQNPLPAERDRDHRLPELQGTPRADPLKHAVIVEFRGPWYTTWEDGWVVGRGNYSVIRGRSPTFTTRGFTIRRIVHPGSMSVLPSDIRVRTGRIEISENSLRIAVRFRDAEQPPSGFNTSRSDDTVVVTFTRLAGRPAFGGRRRS